MVNKERMQLLVVILPIIVILSFIGYEFCSYNFGQEVSLKMEGYDPSDFLRGQYIRYDMIGDAALQSVKVVDDPFDKDDSFWGEAGYLTLIDTDYDGVCDSYGEFYFSKPNGLYLHATCSRFYENDYRVDLVQDRYYIDENIVSMVEDEIREHGEFTIVGSVSNGYIRAKYIEVNNIKY